MMYFEEKNVLSQRKLGGLNVCVLKLQWRLKMEGVPGDNLATEQLCPVSSPVGRACCNIVVNDTTYMIITIESQSEIIDDYSYKSI